MRPQPVPQSILLRQVMLYLNSGSGTLEQAVLLVVAMAVARICSAYFMSAASGVTAVFTSELSFLTRALERVSELRAMEGYNAYNAPPAISVPRSARNMKLGGG